MILTVMPATAILKSHIISKRSVARVCLLKMQAGTST